MVHIIVGKAVEQGTLGTGSYPRRVSSAVKTGFTDDIVGRALCRVAPAIQLIDGDATTMRLGKETVISAVQRRDRVSPFTVGGGTSIDHTTTEYRISPNIFSSQ